MITFIDSLDQPLPNDMKKFWPLSENKVAFQQKFIQWVKENDRGKCVFLSGWVFSVLIEKLMSRNLILTKIFFDTYKF